MGIVGKFVSRAWNGIKNGLGTAGKLIQSGANKAWNFVKENQDTLGKIVGTTLGAGLNLYTGGAAAPFISGANNFIQGLPDNAFTKHLKNIAKASVFDYSTNTIQKEAERKPEQTNASTEYQAPRMSNFVAPSSAVASPSIVRPVTKSPQTKNYNKNNNKNYNNKNSSKKSKGKKTGNKKTKGK